MANIVDALLEAVNHQKLGNPGVAEAIYQDVIRHDPEHPNALYLYGLLQLKDGRTAGAAAMLDRAARLRSDVDPWLHLARARLATGEAAQALEAAETALALGGPGIEALHLHGTALNACRRPAEAIISLTEAVRRGPLHAAARLNLGNALADLDQMEQAEAHIREAIRLDPGLEEAQVSLGFVLASQGRLDDAIAVYESTLRFNPGSGEARWNLATALLLKGDFQRGFSEYEWRKTHRSFRHFFRQLPGPAWTGFPLTGQTLLVHAEQGLGDTIQLARCMPDLAAQGARVVLACDAPLIPLLRNQAGIADIVSRTDDLPPYHCWVDQMSLPRLLRQTPDTIPGAGGYLVCDLDRQHAWKQRLPDARIGLVWGGNPLHTNDGRRSLPPDVARRLARPGMISLQSGPRAAEATGMGMIDLSEHLTDFAETAALIANLDLVITVDTAVAHLAGALGVPVWVMLPKAPDWRWIVGRDDTPWYSSMRLFRQDAAGDWDCVVGRIHAALQAPR
jgi:tetratricopeptide (TPR) repeat protein